MMNNTHPIDGIDYNIPILVAVTGMSPQVVTETLYAIHHSDMPFPKALYLITTKEGKQEAWLNLHVDGQLAALCQDYQLPVISFAENHIFLIEDQLGPSLDDGSNRKEQNFIADRITQLISTFCRETVRLEDTVQAKYQLHASLAGGRKTMTFYLGYAMSLYGRKQDVLSHVLVSPGFESSEFYYPTPYSKPIRTRNGPTLDAKTAKVVLAPIPFIRLRDELPKKLIQGYYNYSQTIERYNLTNDLDALMLIIDRNKWQVSCSGINIEELLPAEVAFLAMFARDAQCHDNDERGFQRPAKDRHTEAALQAFLREFLPERQWHQYSQQPIAAMVTAIAEQEDRENRSLLRVTAKTSIANDATLKISLWDGCKNGLTGKLQDQLGTRLAAHYLPQAVAKETIAGAKRPIELQGLTLKATQIQLIEKR
jgi:CRISPR-associated protein (TIGR02584 family)